MLRISFGACVALGLIGALLTSTAGAAQAQKTETQKAVPQPGAPTTKVDKSSAPAGVATPAGYVIGADDLLAIRVWGDTQLSVDVVVRPDGKISLPLLNDVQAAGLTPEQLNDAIEKAASKFIADPDATVIVREVRSRKVYVLGQVTKPGTVPLNSDMNVLQVLSAAGGLLEYADKSNILITRTEDGRDRRFKFNYNDVIKGKNLQQNIAMKPGDTIIVK